MLILWISWLFSALLAHWGARTAASRILMAFGSFWLVFVIADILGESDSTADYVPGLLMGCLVVAPFFVLARAMHTTVGAQQSQETTSGSKVRVGTFDSRALAMAYYRSEAFVRLMTDLRGEYEKAKAAEDEKRVKELEVEGPAQQELMHKQGFGTWPVDNILKKIKGKMPEIARQADVDVTVSKWNIVYQRSGVALVDVTDLMVRPFNPDEETLGIVKGIQKTDPVPLEELKDHQDWCR
ncbi:MAG TPA: hypothetical protein VK845_03785 [Gemmatimonadales bacterium]|nr:hypothetical protein [Gemmatimonadales bacterium]